MDDESSSQGDQLIGIDQIPSIWDSITIIRVGTTRYVDSLLMPYKGEISEWKELAADQAQEIKELTRKR